MAISREWGGRRGGGRGDAWFWEDEGRKKGEALDGPGIGRGRAVGLGLGLELGLGLRLEWGLLGLGWGSRAGRRTLETLAGEKVEAEEGRHGKTDLSCSWGPAWLGVWGAVAGWGGFCLRLKKDMRLNGMAKDRGNFAAVCRRYSFHVITSSAPPPPCSRPRCAATRSAVGYNL